MDDEPCREEDRLLDRVCDEEAHLARAVPEVEDQILHLLAGQGVECAEGSSISSTSGSEAMGRAMPTRCCIRRQL